MKKRFQRYWIMFRMLFCKHGIDCGRILKKYNIFDNFGIECAWHAKTIPSEPELISIGNNVHVSANVRFITHDVVCDMLNRHPKYRKYAPWPFYRGRIVVGNNVMIGADSIILYDTNIGDNVIIAAGSVVTKDVPSGEIWGGVPAKRIGLFEEFVERRLNCSCDHL